MLSKHLLQLHCHQAVRIDVNECINVLYYGRHDRETPISPHLSYILLSDKQK